MLRCCFLNDLTGLRNPTNAQNMFYHFDDVVRDVSDRLARAASDRKVPMHSPVVVTGDVDARVMVLREFDAQRWTLRFHTDTRAPKVNAIDADPRMAVLFYDQPAKVQIRVRGTGKVLRVGPQVDAAWAESTNFARRCYLGEGPGVVSDAPTSGLPAEFEGVEPDEQQVIPARENFGIVTVTLESLDWFHLAHTGHIRAQFEREGESWEGRWVAP